MPRLIFGLLCALTVAAAPLRAGGISGEFDYYVLSLSWAPNWCSTEGRGSAAPQCDPARDFGWVAHGLWPQYESGWPDYCRNSFAPPSRSQTEAMADIMGSSGSAWHQWDKHGSCSGLGPARFFSELRAAFARVRIPVEFARLDRTVRLPAALIEEAFLRDNPGLTAAGITITCASGHIQEARICLTRDLDFRACGSDLRRDCTLQDALFEPVR